MSDYILEVNNLKKYFSIKGGVFWKEIGKVYAVDDVSIKIKPGETVGLVGESGCGKSTLGRTICRLYEPTNGDILFNNINIIKIKKMKFKDIRKNIQMIFQDPYESLNPRHTVGDIIAEPFIVHKIGNAKERIENVVKLLNQVGLQEDCINRFPHEFSGGQRQRIGIARAIALNPKLIICDEPVSALDVSIQSQILNLLLDLQNKLKLTYLFIAHDLAVVKHISDRVAVMYLGKIVEFTDADTIYKRPLHPYTKALVSAIPVPDPTKRAKRQVLKGDVPSPINPPKGCRFHTRCPYAVDICKKVEPILKQADNDLKIDHLVSCHRVNEI